MTLTIEDGWLAGIIEGEGTIYLRERGSEKRAPKIRVAVKMADEDVIARVAASWDRSYRMIERPEKVNWKDQFKTEISGHPAADLLRRLYPLFGERRRAKIDECMEVVDSWSATVIT